MRFRMLGPVRVWSGGAWTPVAAFQQRLLLATLLLDGCEVVSSDRLVYEIWGDQPPRTAARTVHGYVMRLRRMLGEDGPRLIVTRDHGYELVLGEEDLDAHLFERMVEAGQMDLADGRVELAAARLAEALTLWHGPVLVDLPASPTWAARAAQLDQLRLIATEGQLTALLELGRHQEAVRQLHRLVEEHPLRERLWALLMRAQRADGQRADALATYQRARQMLRDKLGLEPGAGLRQLQLEVLAEDDQPQAPVSISPPRVIPAQLPADVGGFSGRDSYLKELDTLLAGLDGLATSTVVISAIAGTAGVGKTALAVHWAHRVRDRFPDGQLYVNLRGYADGPPVPPITALAGFLRALGVPAEQVPTDVDEASALYRSHLSGKQVLVLLDNARSTDQVRPLLPGSSGCLALATSRNRLAGLVARDGARTMTLNVLTSAEARLLLTRLLGPERANAEPEAVAELARLCSHLPLALRIAAANLASRPYIGIADYNAQLASGRRLDLLEVHGDPEVAVRSALGHSYRTLGIELQRTFRLLSVVPGTDFTAAAVAALADTSLAQATRQLHQLGAAYLVQEVAAGRFALHDLVRLYASERAATEDTGGHRSTALNRLCDFYLRSVEIAGKLLYPADVRLPAPEAPVPIVVPSFTDAAEASGWLDAERSNLVAAVRYAAEHGPHEFAWRLADALSGYLHMGRLIVDWQVVAKAGLAAAHTAASQHGLAAMWLDCIRVDVYTHSDADPDDCRRAVQLTRQIGWTEGEVAALNVLGAAHWLNRRLSQAESCFAEALAASRRVHNQGLEARGLSNLGLVYLDTGRLTESADHLARAVELHRTLEDPSGEAIALSNLAETLHLLGRLADARATFTRALELQREIGGWNIEHNTITALSNLECDCGNHREALELAERAIHLAQERNDRHAEVFARNAEAGAYHHLGRDRQALDGRRATLELAREIEDRAAELEALIGLAAARHKRGDFEPAAEHAATAAALAAEHGYRILEGQALTTLAAVRLGQGDPEAALELTEQALAIHTQTGHVLGVVRTHLVVEQILLNARRASEARAHRAQALRLCAEAGAPLTLAPC